MKRPRISLRTLLILVALVGLYFGCWELTKQRALPRRASPFGTFDSSLAPFIVSQCMWNVGDHPVREYHLWVFGWTMKIFERNAPELLPKGYDLLPKEEGPTRMSPETRARVRELLRAQEAE